MTAEDSKRCSEADAMPATFADLLMLEKRLQKLESTGGINVERPLKPEEARKLLRLSKCQLAQAVDLGRLRVIRTSPRRFVVSQQAVREYLDPVKR